MTTHTAETSPLGYARVVGLRAMFREFAEYFIQEE
jgi:hypothetical protein